VRKFALDSNCYIDASRDAAALGAMQKFVAKAAPGLYISSIVAAEIMGGARSVRDRKVIEDRVLGPFLRQGRIFAPSAAAWEALGRTLDLLREREGLQLSQVPRSFAFDVLLAYSCRENGVVLVTGNARDMARIRKAFAFEYVSPFPATA
jgi:predicted nucleic acid-binding protein